MYRGALRCGSWRLPGYSSKRSITRSLVVIMAAAIITPPTAAAVTAYLERARDALRSLVEASRRPMSTA
jgi:hypothetical protein